MTDVNRRDTETTGYKSHLNTPLCTLCLCGKKLNLKQPGRRLFALLFVRLNFIRMLQCQADIVQTI